MKILILSFYYTPDLCAGSFRCTALVEQLRHLVKPGMEIEIVTTAPNRYSSFAVEAPEYELQSNVIIRRIVLPQHNSGMLDQIKAFIHYAREVKKIVKLEHYALVFATSSRLMSAVLGSWVARKKHCPLYLDIRDIFVDTIGDILSPKSALFCKPLFSLLEKWAFKRAARINLLSQGFKSYFHDRYPAQKFSGFTNGIDQEFIGVEPVMKPLTEIITVVYAGNIGEGQGLHTIIPQLAKSMQGRLRFRLFGDGGRRQKLEAAIKHLACTNVELFPPVSRDRLIEEYRTADVLFLHLNEHNAFKKVLPSKLFEYAALGKPIWAGVSGYAAEFIASEISNAAIFNPCDAFAAEQVFEKLDLESGKRQDFIDKYARQRIMMNMSVDILSLIE